MIIVGACQETRGNKPYIDGNSHRNIVLERKEALNLEIMEENALKRLTATEATKGSGARLLMMFISPLSLLFIRM